MSLLHLKRCTTNQHRRPVPRAPRRTFPIGRLIDRLNGEKASQTNLTKHVCLNPILNPNPKSHQDNLREFPYRLELFRHVSATLLADVADKIPQEPLSPERTRALRTLVDARRDTAALLGAFGVALSMLKKTGGDPSESLVEYARQWLPGYAVRQFEEPLLAGSQLRHVTAHYEVLEESVADVILASSDGLDAAAYRAALPPDVLRELLASTDLFGGALATDVLARALKRFVVRFLTSERCGPDVQASLYLADADFMTWPDGAITVPGTTLEEVFPERLLVRHVARAYEVLLEHIEVSDRTRRAFVKCFWSVSF